MKRIKHMLSFILFVSILFKGCEKEARDDYMTDIDGNRYRVVQIGSKTWMAENLKVTRDRDGNQLETYCYMDKVGKCEEFGHLYPWGDALKASPAGWRLPTSGDWEQLEIELGMDPDEAETFGWRGTNQGEQLKEGGSSGFNVLLSRYRDGVVLWDGRYFDIGYFGAFWSTTDYDSVRSVAYFLYVTNDKVYKVSYDKTAALSVRCVKDD
jgi:uncharacterized protein (TIGR02145 family)